MQNSCSTVLLLIVENACLGFCDRYFPLTSTMVLGLPYFLVNCYRIEAVWYLLLGKNDVPLSSVSNPFAAIEYIFNKEMFTS